jgi:aconitate hydratase
MGVLPLQFIDGRSWTGLGLTGEETVSIAGLGGIAPRQRVAMRVARPSRGSELVEVLCRIDTENEVEYFRNGGILHYVLRGLARAA